MKHFRPGVKVHYDTCDISGPLLHGVKLAPERTAHIGFDFAKDSR